MNHDDMPKFLAMLTAVGELFRAEMSEAKQQLYWQALRDLKLPDVLCGLEQATRDCKFMPLPVEIRERAGESLADAADEAWEEARRFARAGRVPNGEDEALARTIVGMFGSWNGFCYAELEPHHQRQFVELYKRRAASIERHDRIAELNAHDEPKRLRE